MEYVDGIPLRSLVRLRGTLPVCRAITYVLQAAHGLRYAHEQGVIHRDIKPGNLILENGQTVKVLDMGLARVLMPVEPNEETLVGRLTRFGQVMGTPNFMAPEQASDILFADGRADVYSLGCTLYYMLTGFPPYVAANASQVLKSHRDSRIPSVRATRNDVPVDVDAVLQRMLAKRPDDRQQTMAELIQDLSRILPLHSLDGMAAEKAPLQVGAYLTDESTAFDKHAQRVLKAPFGESSYEHEVKRFLSRARQKCQEELAADLAIRLEHRGDNLADIGVHSQALEDYNKAVDMYQRLTEWQCGFDVDLNFARALTQRSRSWRRLGEYQAALGDLSEAVSLLTRLVQECRQTDCRYDLAVYLQQRCRLYLRLAHHTQALDDCSKSIEILTEIGNERSHVKDLYDLGVNLGLWARLWYEKEAYDRSLVDFDEAVGVMNRLAERRSRKGPDIQEHLAALLRGRGKVRLRRYECREAANDFSQAAQVYARLVAQHGEGQMGKWLRTCVYQRHLALQELGQGERVDTEAQIDSILHCVVVNEDTLESQHLEDLDEHNVLHAELFSLGTGRQRKVRIPHEVKDSIAHHNRARDLLKEGLLDEAAEAIGDAIDCLGCLVEKGQHRELTEEIALLLTRRAFVWSKLAIDDKSLADYTRAAELYLELVARAGRKDLLGRLKLCIKSRDLRRKRLKPLSRLSKFLGFTTS